MIRPEILEITFVFDGEEFVGQMELEILSSLPSIAHPDKPHEVIRSCIITFADEDELPKADEHRPDKIYIREPDTGNWHKLEEKYIFDELRDSEGNGPWQNVQQELSTSFLKEIKGILDL